MDDFIVKLIEQAPTFIGLIALAFVLYKQNEKQEQHNDILLERLIELSKEIRDCIKAASQQEETD